MNREPRNENRRKGARVIAGTAAVMGVMLAALSAGASESNPDMDGPGGTFKDKNNDTVPVTDDTVPSTDDTVPTSEVSTTEIAQSTTIVVEIPTTVAPTTPSTYEVVIKDTTTTSTPVITAAPTEEASHTL